MSKEFVLGAVGSTGCRKLGDRVNPEIKKFRFSLIRCGVGLLGRAWRVVSDSSSAEAPPDREDTTRGKQGHRPES